MAYAKSKARKAFDVSLTDINDRLRLAQSTKLQPTLAEYVVASSIFLGHAELENFISDSFAGFAQVAVAASKDCDGLPPNLRAHLFFRRSYMKQLVAKSLAGATEKDFLKLLASSLTGPARGMLDAKTGIGVLVGGDILGDAKYPSRDNLKALFNRLGVSNLFDNLSALLKEDSGLLLASIGSLRTQLAHNATLPGTGYKDIKEVLRKTARFVGALDRVMYGVVVEHYRAAAWRDHLC